jgi:hypothetical protein
VIEHIHIHEFTCLDDGTRHGHIIGAGGWVTWSRGRDAIHRLLCAVFPTPLPKPDMRLSPHPAFH